MMTPLLLVILPLAGAALAAIWPVNRSRPWFLPATGLLHLLLTVWFFVNPPQVQPGAWMGFDALARSLLPVVSLLFFVCTAYGVHYLRIWAERPNRVFVAALLALLGLISAGHQARHLGLLWITTEAVTLAAVPLLHFSRTPRATSPCWPSATACRPSWTPGTRPTPAPSRTWWPTAAFSKRSATWCPSLPR